MYCSSTLRSALSDVSKSADRGKKALKALQSGAKENDTTFRLQMNFKVGAEKMASAIADSVAPRHNGSSNEVEQLKEMIFNGVATKGAAVKGTTMEFECSKGGVGVKVDGKEMGTVPSPGLAKAFCDVYLDENGVSPTLKNSCLENCFGQ